MVDPADIGSALRTVVAYGAAAERAAARPYRAARFDTTRRPSGRPGPSIPVDLSAIDATREVRLLLCMACMAHARATRTPAPHHLTRAPLSALARYLLAEADPHAGYWETSHVTVDGRPLPLGEALRAAADPLPRLAEALPRTTSPPPPPSSLPPSRRGLPVTAAQAADITAAMGLPVPASTIRRWGAEGTLAPVSSAASTTRRYRLGDVLDAAAARAGVPGATPAATPAGAAPATASATAPADAPTPPADRVLVDGEYVDADTLRARLGLDCEAS